MIRVFHGNDELSIDEAVTRVRESAGPPEVRDPNTTVFEGSGFKAMDVMAAASAVPFLADRRVVIVSGLLGRIDSRDRSASSGWEHLGDMLKEIPATTELLFVDHQGLRRNGAGLRAVGPGADIREFATPRGPALEAWIRERFAAQDVQAQRDAVARLAWLVGGKLRLLDQEIRKLALYVGDRPVTRRDVDEMVPDAREANIFAAVDAVLEQRPGVAMRLMYSLLDGGATVGSILNMLARQVRLVLLAGDLRSSGVAPEDIGRRIGLNSRFALEKTLRQAGRFRYGYLAAVHRRLLVADLSIKTGQMDERLALELLAARISGVS